MRALALTLLLAVSGMAGLAIVATPVEAQCAMCRTALEGSEEGRRAARNLNRGILVLLAAPFLVVAGVGLAGRPARRDSRSNDR